MVDASAFADDPSRPLRELIDAGRFRDVLDAYRGSADAVRQRPETELLAATAATRLGELSLGATLAEAALQHFKSRSDGDGRMRAVNLLGVITFQQGRTDFAEQAFGEALEIARGLEDSVMTANAANNLAAVADLRQKPDLALSLYRSALLAYQRLGDRRGTAQTYHNLGLTFRQMGEWEDANDAALQAVRHAEQVGERSLIALVVMGRAELLLERGEHDLAKQELVRAERAARDAGDEIGEVEVERIRARLAFVEGEHLRAAEIAEAARTAAERLRSAQLQAECAALAARAFRRLGRLEEMEARYIEAVRLFEELGANKLLADFRQAWESD